MGDKVRMCLGCCDVIAHFSVGMKTLPLPY